MKHWLVATYKINELRRLETNLINQNFHYYLPKIITKKISHNIKELMFPGYIFVNISLKEYSSLKYTKGIKNIIKFGENISFLTNKEVESIRIIEKSSEMKPIKSKIRIGQEAIMTKGPFKGLIVKICSLPYKERIDVFMSLLGSRRKIEISENDFIL